MCLKIRRHKFKHSWPRLAPFGPFVDLTFCVFKLPVEIFLKLSNHHDTPIFNRSFQNKSLTKTFTLKLGSWKSRDMELQAGTIIKFKNLVGKPEYNGRCGVITKQLPNGRFGVIVDASKIDLSFNKKNLQILSFCPNEQRLNTEGVLIWPHVKGVNQSGT